MRKKMFSIALALSALAISTANTAAPRTERIGFAKGSSSKTVKGTISGYDYVDYVIWARHGRLLSVNLTSNRGSNYFNIMPQGSDEAYFIGSNEGNAFSGRMTASGDQIVRVYLMRNDARRGVVANYTLRISIAN